VHIYNAFSKSQTVKNNLKRKEKKHAELQSLHEQEQKESENL